MHPKLIEDPEGMVFEYLDVEEAEFLYEEVFIRRSYLQHGIAIGDNVVVIDAGANIGLFSLQCLREAKGAQVYAFEPIPPIYDILIRNLDNSIDSVKTGTSPRPIALQVALGEKLDEGEFTFFGTCPGESTRHPEEREEQQHKLLEDEDASSWRQALKPGSATEPLTQPTTDYTQGGSCTCSAATMAGADDKSTELAASVPDTAPGTTSADIDDVPTSRAEVVQTRSREDRGEVPGQMLEATRLDREIPKDAHSKYPVSGDEQRQGVPFVCTVVPLSLALGQLGLTKVDLLKVDVEGDELAVLRGISDDDWPKIQQIVVEVHDVDDRLAATIELLQSKTVAFDEVCWDSQRTSEVRGYVMVVPEALNMFLVFAKRRQKVSGADSTPPTAVDGCGKNSHEVDDNIGSGTAWSSAGEEKRRCDVGKPPRFCSCGSASRTVGS